MIKIEINGTLPAITADFSKELWEVAEMMFISINENFNQGGRPRTWKPLKKTGQPSHLRQSGAMQNALYKTSNKNTAEVGMSSRMLLWV